MCPPLCPSLLPTDWNADMAVAKAAILDHKTLWKLYVEDDRATQ